MGLLVPAIAAALLTWILLNGANPNHLTAPEG
jgi:putative oxidoreductase